MKTLHIFSLAIITAGVIVTSPANAQYKKNNKAVIEDENDYTTAIGIRAGQTSGLTLKHFINNETAIEGIFGIWPYAFGIAGLCEKHARAFNTEGLRWYYGGGGHLTLGTGRVYYAYYDNENRFYKYSSGNLAVGVDGIVGLEYKIKAIPVALGADIKPFLEINNEGALYLSIDPAITAKITF